MSNVVPTTYFTVRNPAYHSYQHHGKVKKFVKTENAESYSFFLSEATNGYLQLLLVGQAAGDKCYRSALCFSQLKDQVQW